MMMHTTADDPKKYRKEEEVEGWRKRDPIARFQKYLKEKGLLPDKKVKALEKQIEDEISAAVRQAEEKMKSYTDPLSMFDHAYAEPTPVLRKQREELDQELREMEEKNHG
jgi:TPP-dependent pyruvate/acetoin dehydrogenase alpha subunit